MNTPQPGALRSKGIAHLYAAVAKADGIVSGKEKRRAPYHGRKSQQRFDLFQKNESVRMSIAGDIAEVFSTITFHDWPARDHLEKGIQLLNQAASSGDWATQLVGPQIQDELEALARLDGYNIKESKMLAEIREKLRELE